MSTQNESKLKTLIESVPQGTVCLASWLEDKGYIPGPAKALPQRGMAGIPGAGSFHQIRRYGVLALKGGTAINLFVRDMPRLSVDIDLTYVHFDVRANALENISQAVRRIKDRVERGLSGVRAVIQAQADAPEARLVCALGHAQVKVEVNTVIRGIIKPTRLMQVTARVQEEFEKFAAIQVVSPSRWFPMKNFSGARCVRLWTGSIRAICLTCIICSKRKG